MFEPKFVRIIEELGDCEEIEHSFESNTLPMAKHHAESWARRNGLKVIKSPAKIAAMFNPHREPVNRNEVIWYIVNR